MRLKGFCKPQGKEYCIDVDTKGANCLEDLQRNKYIIGRIDCNYASDTGKCNGDNCSILEQNRIRR